MEKRDIFYFIPSFRFLMAGAKFPIILYLLYSPSLANFQLYAIKLPVPHQAVFCPFQLPLPHHPYIGAFDSRSMSAEQVAPLITQALSAVKAEQDAAQEQLNAFKPQPDYATSLLYILLQQVTIFNYSTYRLYIMLRLDEYRCIV